MFVGFLYARRTFKDVGHLADLSKRGAVSPSVDHIHQVRLKLAEIRVLVHLQLGVCRHLGYPFRTLLNTKSRHSDLKQHFANSGLCCHKR